MAHSGWTPEPWTYDQDLRDLEVGGEHVQTAEALTIWAADGDIEICTISPTGIDERSVYELRYTPEAWANARRIVAAINACQGIPTEALEGGVIAEMRAALETVERIFDQGTDTEWDRVYGKIQNVLARLRVEVTPS